MNLMNTLNFKRIREFGGIMHKSHPKSPRPISLKYPIHLVLKSSSARGEYSMRSLRNVRAVQRIVRQQAKKFHLRLLELTNEGQHLHILGKVRHRHDYIAFIRAITGLIARQCLMAEKGQAKKIKFWDFRPYSRVVDWFVGYKIAQDEQLLLHLSAIGMIPVASLKPKWSSA